MAIRITIIIKIHKIIQEMGTSDTYTRDQKAVTSIAGFKLIKPSNSRNTQRTKPRNNLMQSCKK